VNVLHEIELLVSRRGPKVLPDYREHLPLLFAFLCHHKDARLPAEWRVCQDHVESITGVGAEAVIGLDRRWCLVPRGADTMEQEVHGANPGDGVHDFHATQCIELKVLLLVPIEIGIVADDVVVSGEKESTGAAGGITDRHRRPRPHDVYDGLNQGPRGEVLARSALDVLRVLFQQPLVGITLHICVEAGPLFLINEISDEPPELCWVLNLVLRLPEDEAEHAGFLAQLFECVPVVYLQRVAIFGEQSRPGVFGGNRGWLVPRRLRPFISHFQEEEVRQLFEIVTVREAVIPKDMAVAPKLLDDLLRRTSHGVAATIGCIAPGRRVGPFPVALNFPSKAKRNMACRRLLALAAFCRADASSA
jgi:hypothetical protein